MSETSDEETKHSFCLNFGEGKFEEAYDLTNTKQLAKQANGSYTMKLFTAQNIATKEFFAVKKVSASRSEFLDNTWKELNAIISIKDHKSENVIKYHQAFLYDKPVKNQNERKQVLIIVMELGEYTLYDKIKYGLQENDAYQKLQETLKGIQCLKMNNIYHRDIKPHNLVVKNNQVKIIDLDVSKNTPYAKTQKITEKFGTKIYMDPRLRFLDVNLQDENYYLNVEKSDLFSVGLTFAQLARKMTQNYYRDWKIRMDNYVLQNEKNLYEQVLKEELDQIHHQELKHILKNLLCYQVEDRWDLQKALELEKPILIEEEEEEEKEEEEQQQCEQKKEIFINIRKNRHFGQFINKYENLDIEKISNYKLICVQFSDSNQEERMKVISIISEKFQLVQNLIFKFNKCNIKPDEMIQLLQRMKELKSEISLNIEFLKLKIEDKITGQLFQAIQSIPKLILLIIDLRYNEISNLGAQSIAEEIELLPSLTTLDINLSSNLISNPGAESIADLIKKLPSLTSLTIVLGYNEINNTGVKSITGAIKQLSSITSLTIDLDSNEISNLGVKSIAYAIRKLASLTSLNINLRSNQISSPGVETIAGAIHQLQNLISLTIDFSYNQISNPGIENIADAIKELPSINKLSLDLFSNQISYPETKSIVDAIKHLQCLTTLIIDLGYNQISHSAAENIIDAIKQLPKLKTLYLNDIYCQQNNV